MSDLPEVVHIFRTYRQFPSSPKLDTWCVFIQVDGKLTYWLMDNMDKASKVDDEVDVWRKFIHEWERPEYGKYKRDVVLGRNMNDAQARLDSFMKGVDK